MKYEQPTSMTRPQAESAALSESVPIVTTALVAVSLYESDRVWAEAFIVRHLKDPRPEVAGAAASSIGNLARRNRYLSGGTIEAIRQALLDPRIEGRAQDALNDIGLFVSSD